MYLLLLRDDEDPSTPLWRVVTPLRNNDPDACDFLAWIEGLAARERKEASRLLARLLDVAKHQRGPTLFDTRECHHIATATVVTDSGAYRQEKIWELIGSRTRITWFYGGGERMVVISHGFLKTSQRTPSREQDRAIRQCVDYFAARRAKRIQLIEDEK